MFLPENIDLSKAERYTLTIRIKSDGFSFLIQDVEDIDSFTYQETAFSNDVPLVKNIQRIIFDLNFLTDNFRKVNVISVSPKYEIVPAQFYESKNSRDLYNFTHTNKQAQIQTCAKKQTGLETIFEMEDEIYSFLIRSLFNPLFYHHSSLGASFYAKKMQGEKEKNALFLNFHDQYVDLVCFDSNRQIMHMQTYLKEHEKNLVYFILNIWEKCKFDQQSDFMFIYGQPAGNNIENLLREYIRNIKNEDLSNFGEKAKTIPLDVLILQE